MGFSSLKLFNPKENEVQIINTEGKRKTFNHTRDISMCKSLIIKEAEISGTGRRFSLS